jgi:hypothetical protein
LLESYLKELKSINKKGYVNDTDLSKYPIIKELIPKIVIKNGEGGKCDVLIGGNYYSYTTAKELFK